MNIADARCEIDIIIESESESDSDLRSESRRSNRGPAGTKTPT